MNVLAWFYLAGAALTLGVSLLLNGWRDWRDVMVALFMGALWPLVWILALGAALGDTDQ